MANNANSSTLTTDFNVSPYYDDYDKTKKFYKNLFKPGYAVQARELTQSQTFLQQQVARFGQHVFQEGSIVIPGTFDLLSDKSVSGPMQYVKVNDYDSGNNAIDINDYLYQTVTGGTSGISGEISFVSDGTQSATNTKTIYVDYTSAGNSNSSLKTFSSGEILVSNVGTLVVASSNATGTGSAFRISEGIVFAKEHFIYFDTQGIVLERYNPNPTGKVGFQIIESIVDASDDASLLDPALESSNYSAPGADRLKLTATLKVLDINNDAGAPDFATLFTVKDGIIISNNERSQYNILQDELAKRTFDESGNYYVDGFNMVIRENSADGENNGVIASANGGNSQLLYVEVSSGLAYVQGYERTTPSQYIPILKSIEYNTVNSQLASASIGSWLSVKEFTGSWPHDVGQTINLYDVAQTRLTSNKWSTGTQTGNLIGSATLVSLDHNSGTMGTPSCIFDVYLTDIQMVGSNTFSGVRSFYYDNASTADIGADVILNTASNTAVLQETSEVPLLYYVGSNFVKTLKPNGASDTTFIYKKTTEVANVSSGIFNVTLPTGADDFPYGTATLTAAQKREIFMSVGADSNVTMAGVVSNVGTAIIGSGTNFDRLNVGEKIAISAINGLYYIASISNATYMTVTTALASPATAYPYVKRYKTGDLIDLTNIGATAGATRIVTSTAATQLSFDLKETLSGTVPATVTYRVTSTGSNQINKTLRPNRYVQINVNAHSTSTSGPYSLGIPDVYRIKEIKRKSSIFTANTEGSDVTNSFVFDSGQRDLIYDHASITPRIGISNTDFLLVKLDYFEPDFTVGQGFFSVDSYPINDNSSANTAIKTAKISTYTSPTSGETYDLRNYIDFRPIKAKTAADSVTVGSATINPTATTSYNYDSNGMRIPAAYSQISFDYQYYLAKRLLITLDKNRKFTAYEGISAENPLTPILPASAKQMVIGTAFIAPYPSLSSYYANIIRRPDLACTIKRIASVRFTQHDIGALKERIVNLEYYASLSLLEKAAADLVIPDTSGLDRFKNGIFVDTFADHSLGATYNSDYNIVVDSDEKSLRPIYTVEPVKYDIVPGSMTNVVKVGDLIFLDYDEVEYLDYSAVTTNRNTERTTYRFTGQMDITPPIDVWTDTQTVPEGANPFNFKTQNDDFSVIENNNGFTTTWNAWQRFVTGITPAPQDNFNLNSVSIENVDINNRVGVQNYNGTQINTQGNNVVDTSILPYIRPQNLYFKVQGIKPYARHYVYFDGLLMSAYVTPLSAQEYSILSGRETIAAGTILDSGVLSTGTVFQPTQYSEGAILTANKTGVAYFKLRLPAGDTKRFTFGTKRIDVVDNISNSEEDFTSKSVGFFTAQGLTQLTQKTTPTTRPLPPATQPPPPPTTSWDPPEVSVPPIPPVIVQTREVGGTWWNNATVDERLIEIPWEWGMTVDIWGVGHVCLAYAFKVNIPDTTDGMFITKVDVFFSEKHPDLGVWFEVLETDPTGAILSDNTLPFSKVWLTNDEVAISNNGISNATTISFPSPVFVQKNKFYAFTIHPEAGNPNYYLWASRIGETDINTGLPVTSRKNTGRLYTTNNGYIYDVVPDMDLTMKVYRASFSTSTSGGNFTIGAKAKEKLYLNNLTSSISNYGSSMSRGDYLTITGITGGTINVTDRLVGTNSQVNSSIVSISSTYNTNNVGYLANEAITVRFANGTSKGVTANVSAVAARPIGIIEKATESATQSLIILTNSSGGFAANDTIITDTGITATVNRVDNFRYTVVDFEPSYLKFASTFISHQIKPYSNVGVAGSFTNVNPNDNYIFDSEQALFSKSNEVLTYSNTRTQQIKTTMSTSSEYVSPVFDLVKTQSILVDNIVNSNTVNESAASGGYLYNKYISKTITLADGQDAEDIRVIITAYRPPTSDIKMWIRLLNAEDGASFSQRTWIELEKMNDADGVYSSQSDYNDFIEYSYQIPSAYLTGPNGAVQYRNLANTATLTGFKHFAVKIGLSANNSAVIPRVADLRTLAIQT
jgi:hypothetical protein